MWVLGENDWTGIPAHISRAARGLATRGGALVQENRIGSNDDTSFYPKASSSLRIRNERDALCML